MTLYLPIPVEEGSPDLGAAIVERGSAVGGNFSYRVVETQYGPMLRITAERVTVTPRYYEFVERNGTRASRSPRASTTQPTRT